MINVTDPSKCCGCTACASICSNGAISMKPDVLGFLYPYVDKLKCINCGLCDKVCSFNSKYDKSFNFVTPFVFGGRSKDIKEVMKSRSGAVFAILSDYVLEQGGVIYGAGMEHFRVIHKRAVTKLARDEFRGSKYVQSDLQGVFIQIRDDLREGKLVLFSGTACQTSGLRSFLGRKVFENLILVDIVCHGVPSPYIWRDYINFIEKTFDVSVTKAEFRDKVHFGWHAHREIFYVKGKIIDSYRWYTDIFYKNLAMRWSCGKCPFCNIIRPSDLTLADFWGWQKSNSKANTDDKGINLILVNTIKGKSLFDMIKDRLDYFPVKGNSYLQPNLMYPSQLHPKRKMFEIDYENFGFEYVFMNTSKYDYPLYMRIQKKICRIIHKLKK